MAENLSSQFGPVLVPTGQQSGLIQDDLGQAGRTGPGVMPGTGPDEIAAPHLDQRQPITPGTKPGLLSTDITLNDEASEPVPAGAGHWDQLSTLTGAQPAEGVIMDWERPVHGGTPLAERKPD